jgi:DNA-binding transcriptional regulator YiaG
MAKRAAAKKRGETLPDLLRKWRESKGLTKADAARMLDIPYRTLQDWELGNRTPRGFALKAITARLKRH